VLWAFGGYLVITHQVSVGTVVTFATVLLARLYGPVGQLTTLHVNVVGSLALFQRIFDYQDLPVEIDDRPDAQDAGAVEGAVSFDDVTFSYREGVAPALDHVSFDIEPGQLVALVGPSGAGKTTATSLLPRFYDPQEGVIRIDGQRLEDIPRGALAASVSFVDQDVFLFEGTVRDNVALWDPSIPDEAVVDALRDAALYDVVMRRPGGIHSKVEQDGRNFSGGQRQRLEIARALVRRPSILVLDEVTSALDAETELIVMDNLRKRGCACVVIAHRLSTVRDSDEIVVLQHGTIVERGRHEELVARGGAYAALVRER
jgi:ABC-type multidrug transport system fused ATPase/permease subunit